MFHGLLPAIIVLGIAYAVYKLVELFARRKERMALIDKIDIKDGVAVSPDMINWLSPPAKSPFPALRIGLLLAGLGLGLGIAIIMSYNMEGMERDMLYFASMLFFGGLGLVISFIIEQKQKK